MCPSPSVVARQLAELEEVARLIGQTRRKVWNGVARVLAPEGEAVLGWALVATLARLGPQRQRDLADVIGQHPAGVSRQLEALDAAGLTTRMLSDRDRRCRLVALTPRGQRWHRRWRPRVLAAVGEVLGILDVAERDALARLLQKVLTGQPAATRAPGRPLR